MAIVANALLVLLSIAAGFRLFARYSVRPRAHSLWYGVGLVLTATAALPELYYTLSGGVPTPLWWLYWSSASATVGFLGVGTAYLIGPRFGRVALWAAVLLSVWAMIATVLTGGAGPGGGGDVLALFSKAPTGAIKLPFVLQNILGSLVIFGGAIASFIQNRAFYNVLIALGTLVFASGGSAAGLINFPGIFHFTQTAGIILLYFGVTLSIAPRAGS